ncbi:MAG: hypothetical protein IPM56_05920 [Ignavibacteriales bacterium]|nr:MAG: hypothetical protein IPM56_05920 [Ignavibacteriales bacterium]
MRKTIIYILVPVLILLTVFVMMYVTNIYEVEIRVTPEQLFADNSSTVLIEVYPINGFGMKAPFRKINATFEITSGKELVDIVDMKSESGMLKLKAKDTPGMVVVLIKPEKALLPSEVRVPVQPNLTLMIDEHHQK